jgi:hypothetical protein
MSAQMTLVSSPVTFTTPTSGTRWYFGGAMSQLINGQIYILLPYRPLPSTPLRRDRCRWCARPRRP